MYFSLLIDLFSKYTHLFFSRIKNYIDEIIQATLTRPDVIGIVGNYYHNGEYKKDFIHSIRYNKWRETDKVYERNPNHLNPIRREFIFKIGGFDESKTWGEDKDLSSRIFKYLKTLLFILILNLKF